MNMKFEFEDIIKEKAPDYRLIAVEAEVESLPTDDSLWSEITAFAESYRSCHEMAEVNKRPGIAGTREAYKAFGKEPNRYRPSTEALCRRFVKGLDLYQPAPSRMRPLDRRLRRRQDRRRHIDARHRPRGRAIRSYRPGAAQHCLSACLARLCRRYRHTDIRQRTDENISVDPPLAAHDQCLPRRYGR